MKTNIIKTLCITALAAALPVNSLASSAAYSEPATSASTSAVTEVTGTGTEDDPFTLITTTADENDSYFVVTSTFDISDEENGPFSFSGDMDISVTDDEQAGLNDICSTIYFSSDSTDDTDYGDLTEDEITELNSLYDQLSAIYMTAFPDDSIEYTDEEYNAFFEAHQEELDKLNDRIIELEEKAGFYSDFYYGFDDMDYGNLTEDEITELNTLYDKVCALFDEAFPGGEEWSDEKYDAIIADNQELFDRLSELEQKAGWVTKVEVSAEANINFDNLTEDEIAEFNELYDKVYTLFYEAFPDSGEWTDDIFDTIVADNQELFDRLDELEHKAGWFSEFDVTADCEVDYGDLTEDEIAELNGLYDQIDDIYAQAFPEDREYSDEEYAAFDAEYQEELDRIIERIIELEQKAGWYGEYCFDDEVLESALTEEEYAEYQQIMDRFSEIDALVIGDNEELSDEEFEAGYAQYQDEMDKLAERLTQLYEKAYGDDSFVFCGDYYVTEDEDIV